MSALIQRFKNWDRFGEPVTVNYEGDDTFKTCGGACFSLFTYILVLAFAVVQAEQLLLRTDPAISQTTEFVNYAHSNDQIAMDEQMIDLVLKLQIMKDGAKTRSFDKLADERFGRIIAYQV